MSRSRRKTPYLTDGQDSAGVRKLARRLANRKVRRQKDLASGGAYKRVYESWNICDYKFLDKVKGYRK